MKEPPKLHPNMIDAIYLQYRNNGVFYLPRLLGPPQHIDEWRDEQLRKTATAKDSAPG